MSDFFDLRALAAELTANLRAESDRGLPASVHPARRPSSAYTLGVLARPTNAGDNGPPRRGAAVALAWAPDQHRAENLVQETDLTPIGSRVAHGLFGLIVGAISASAML